MMLVAGVCTPGLGCKAVGWRLWGALLVCVFLWAPQGLVGCVGLLSMVDVASAPCFVAVGVAVGWLVEGN